MFTIAANIFKSLLRPKDNAQITEPFTPIGFWLEKKLKHEDATRIKRQQIGHLSFWYQRPYELLKTYQDIFCSGIYRFETAEQQPIIVDCGANIGLGVMYFKQLYPNATVIAFEPDQANADLLEKNVKENHLTQVTVKREAVWTSHQPLQFAAAGTEASRIDSHGGSTTVQGIDFKYFLQQFPMVDFLKMDIEGAEHAVLAHCADELYRVKHMFLEYHGYTHKPQELANLFSLIDVLGFTCYVRNAADSIAYPFKHRATDEVYNVQLNLFLTKKSIQ